MIDQIASVAYDPKKHDVTMRALKRFCDSACPEEDVLIEMNGIRELPESNRNLATTCMSLFHLFRDSDLRREKLQSKS